MEDLENKNVDVADDDVFDIDITTNDPDGPLWDKLAQQIIADAKQIAKL